MKITVVYALPEQQIVRELDLQVDATVRMALERSGLFAEFPEIDMPAVQVGIFGLIVSPAAVLQPGDRVEIYRALRAEPKESRRKRLLGR